jgi:hypothetical protein
MKFLVFGASKVKSSTTTRLFSLAFNDKADLRANLFKFLFNLKE